MSFNGKSAVASALAKLDENLHVRIARQEAGFYDLDTLTQIQQQARTSPNENQGGTGNNSTAQQKKNNNNLYVTGLAPTTHENDLRYFFGRFGEIDSVRIWKQGVAFIRFSSSKSARYVLDHCNNVEWEGCRFRVSYARWDIGPKPSDESIHDKSQKEPGRTTSIIVVTPNGGYGMKWHESPKVDLDFEQDNGSITSDEGSCITDGVYSTEVQNPITGESEIGIYDCGRILVLL